MLIKQANADGTTGVTFRMSGLAGITQLNLLGDFNGWDNQAHPLTPAEDGTWSATLTLVPGEYRFRYFANGELWLNDDQADAYAFSEYGSENSVVQVAEAAMAAEASVAEVAAEAPAAVEAEPAPAPKKTRAPAKPKAEKPAAAPKKRAPSKK